MGRRSRCLCAVLACTAFFAAAGLAPRTAAADDWAEPVQTSSSTSTSTATNDNATIQRASPTQTGGSEQSQSTIQVAPTQQSANATSRSNQSAANLASGGTANQENKSSSSAVSRNANETKQSSAQDQESAPPPDPAPSQTQSQSSSQSAPTTQHADASATSNQVAPTNINVSVRIDSPGENGPVNQANSSTANAVSDNANTSAQDLKQTQGGGRPAGEQSQSADQSAPTNQVAGATSSSNQVAPTNLNITIRNKSPGDDGAVTQTNASDSSANAGNTNASNQSAGQVQEGAGHTSYPPASTPQPTSAGTTQSQTSMQSAPTTQSSNATATSVQQAPTGGDVSVTVDKDARDPSGSDRRGTLIQIWIPANEGWPDTGEPTRTNSSSAGATAVNSNETTQSAGQRQTASSGGATQVGGGSQTQAVRQSAPTTQTAPADAASKEIGSAAGTNISLSKATVDNANQTTQSAMQIQEGGLAGGSQVQIVKQTAPTVQSAIAQALSVLTGATNPGTDGWSLQTNISSAVVTAGKSNQTTQSAEQVQVGTSVTQSQVQVVEQSVANAVHTHARQVCRRRCVSSGSTLFTLEHQLSVWSSSTGKDSSRSRESGASKKKTDERAPRDGQLPRGPELPGAAAGSSSGGGGGSLWIFAALLIPFALTASWWARHYGPSAFRRLAGVVVRPERPG